MGELARNERSRRIGKSYCRRLRSFVGARQCSSASAKLRRFLPFCCYWPPAALRSHNGVGGRTLLTGNSSDLMDARTHDATLTYKFR
ncbi:hypothetical protein EVAR_51474_1 [Eumeta japonica]|uniref:Uncharacterized protein n=1 Tax=Eumeta variegata TaxID=151549 RepID=A0A4C1Z533_EUMVA|nr:hypothetical protein EVAR_51474_1 [Eumeta japonica]